MAGFDFCPDIPTSGAHVIQLCIRSGYRTTESGGRGSVTEFGFKDSFRVLVGVYAIYSEIRNLLESFAKEI